MEAFCGTYYWARMLSEFGHQDRLISPQFGAPYVESNKNYRNDAEVICEAVGRPSMRFVPQNSSEQLETPAVHRIRQRLISDRTRLVNQIRSLLAEHGFVITSDISRLRQALRQVVDGCCRDAGVPEMIRELVIEIREELAELDNRIAFFNSRIRVLFRTNEACQRIDRIEPITATALVAAAGDQGCFRNGRKFAAWFGLIPKQRSSGGKARLFGISKRGDRYLLTLMIHVARAVLDKAHGKTDARSLWISRLRE